MQLQLAGGTGMGIAGFGLGFLDVGEDLLAAQQVALAGLGEGDATSGTVEQAGAQVRPRLATARET